jgi:hypothetical protein
MSTLHYLASKPIFTAWALILPVVQETRHAHDLLTMVACTQDEFMRADNLLAMFRR